MNELETMRIFVAVADSGSFSGAARKLRLQQSTVSRAISQLESEYRTALVTRTTRKMALTEAGTSYLADSRRILAEIENVRGRMMRIREEPKGLLRVGLSTAFGKLIVVPTLPAFKRKYPDVTLEVHFEDRMVDIVAEGYDVVIRVGASEDSLITSRKIAVVRRGLFVSRSLHRQLGRIQTPTDLERYPALLFDDRVPPSPVWRLAQGRSRQKVRIPSVTAVNQLDSLFALLKEGLGVAYVPLFFNEAALGESRLEQVLPDWEVMNDLDAASGVYALFPGGSKVSAKVRVFIDHLVEELGAIR